MEVDWSQNNWHDFNPKELYRTNIFFIDSEGKINLINKKTYSDIKPKVISLRAEKISSEIECSFCDYVFYAMIAITVITVPLLPFLISAI